MAKPSRPTRRRVPSRGSARKTKRSATRSPRKTSRPRPKRRPKARQTKATAKKTAPRKAKPEKVRATAPRAKTSGPRTPHPAALERQRRHLSDIEPGPAGPPPDDRLVAEARSGRHALEVLLREHTATSPALTAGDVDADWEEAYAVGDEAPGGDNPTPDQNEVDEIGQALGTPYQPDEPLRSGDKIARRDKHRWELNPASREDDGETR